MMNPDLPRGVPSPNVAHVHPYPTRFHGGVWKRPVFGFPWNRSPYAVFRGSQMNGLGEYIDPTFRPYHGLGQAVDTAGGVFRKPLLQGGGIFNDVSGLGALPSGTGALIGGALVGFAVVAFVMTRK